MLSTFETNGIKDVSIWVCIMSCVTADGGGADMVCVSILNRETGFDISAAGMPVFASSWAAILTMSSRFKGKPWSRYSAAFESRTLLVLGAIIARR